MFSDIEDNAIEPTPSPFPDIPAEMPGVEREREVPLSIPATAPIPSDEDAAAAEYAAVLQNSNIAPNILAIPRNIAGVRHQDVAEAIPPHIYNINVIPAQVDEIDDGNEDGAHDEAEYDNAEGEHHSAYPI